MRIERLPFTVYDLIGYLVPGLLFLWVILSQFGIDREFIGILSPINSTENGYGIWFFIAVFLLLSFFTGHILIFLSSVSVEKISVAYFDYPSKYVTRSHPKAEWSIVKSVENYVNGMPYGLCIFIVNLVILFIISIFIQFICSFNLHHSVTKKFPQSIVEMLMEKFSEKTLSAGKIEKEIDSKKSVDCFRFVRFYVINNNPSASLRMYNYITMYGFMRSMTFISVIMFWISLKAFFDHDDILGINYEIIKYHIVYFIFSFWIISIFSFLGFQKFLRQYTEEAILAFVTKEDEPREAP